MQIQALLRFEEIYHTLGSVWPCRAMRAATFDALYRMVWNTQDTKFSKQIKVYPMHHCLVAYHHHHHHRRRRRHHHHHHHHHHHLIKITWLSSWTLGLHSWKSWKSWNFRSKIPHWRPKRGLDCTKWPCILESSWPEIRPEPWAQPFATAQPDRAPRLRASHPRQPRCSAWIWWPWLTTRILDCILVYINSS